MKGLTELDLQSALGKLIKKKSMISDSLALKVCKRGGVGAITATSNISGKLLCYIINNYKKELEIENFQLLQQLQEQTFTASYLVFCSGHYV